MSSESLPVEFLTTTQVTDKGQLTVPSQYRDALQLEKGAQVAVLRLGGALLLMAHKRIQKAGALMSPAFRSSRD